MQKRKKALKKQLHKNDVLSNNERDSLTSRHKLTLDRLIKMNQSRNEHIFYKETIRPIFLDLNNI